MLDTLTGRYGSLIRMLLFTNEQCETSHRTGIFREKGDGMFVERHCLSCEEEILREIRRLKQ